MSADDTDLQVGDLWSRAVWAFDRPSARIKNFNKHSASLKKKWHKKVASQEGRAIRLARRFDVGLDLRDHIFESDIMPPALEKGVASFHDYRAFSKITHLTNSLKVPFSEMWIEWERPSDKVLQACLIEQNPAQEKSYFYNETTYQETGYKTSSTGKTLPKGSTTTAFTFYTFDEKKRELAPHEWAYIIRSVGAPSFWKARIEESHSGPVSYAQELARGIYSTNILDDEPTDLYAPHQSKNGISWTSMGNKPSAMWSQGAKTQDQYKESCRRALPDKSLSASQSLDDFFDLVWRSNLMHKTMVLSDEPDVLTVREVIPDHPMLFVLKLIEVLNYPWISKDYVDAGNQQKSRTPRVTPSDAYYRCRINLPKPDGITVKEPNQREGVYGKRLHQVRGHWRIYTDEFGNFKKKIWIKSHRRGDAKLGVVHKDYVLTAETEKKEQYA